MLELFQLRANLISIGIARPEIAAFTINEQKNIYMPGLNHQTDYDLN